MTFYLSLAVALAAFIAAGWFAHAWYTRNRAQKARPGYIPTPADDTDPWKFTRAPEHSLYDQDAPENVVPLTAALGNPLIPDPIDVATIQRELGPEAAAIASAMDRVFGPDTHSRRV